MQMSLSKFLQENSRRKQKAGWSRKLPAVSLGLIFAIVLSLLYPADTFARQGDSGYEGGISTGETPNVTSTTASSKAEYQYEEPCFLTGDPIMLSGKLTITKKLKEDTRTKVQTLTTQYVYTLKNSDRAATLTRNLTFVTAIIEKPNGQKTESTQLTKATETLVAGGVSYRIANITDYVLSKSILNDIKPAVNYYAGNLWSKKTYRTGTATSDTVVVESTGKYYGYDQYWSSAEAQVINQTISLNKPGKAPVIVGNIDLEISTTTKKDLKYYENAPDEISFSGGYVQTQSNENVLKYTANLSERDKNKQPTGKIVKYNSSLSLPSFPAQTRLVSPSLSQIKGHPSEDSITLLFGLEAFDNAAAFDPEEYMSRAEFIDLLVKVAKAVPQDPVFTKARKPASNTKNITVTSPFVDIPVTHAYFDSINDAAQRGIASGGAGSKFRPDALVSVAEAVTMMMNSLGLTGLAPNPAPVTSFKDNDKIPSYARASIYVADRIGLINEDAKGYINPDGKITKAEAADMMKVFIDYMSNGIRDDYMEKLISY